MSTVTETDLKELKTLINSRFDEIKIDLSNIDKRLTVIETRLEDWKPSIDKVANLAEKSAKAHEKLDSIHKSLNDLKQQSEKQDGRLWLLVTGLFLTLLGAVAKIVFFPSP